MTEPLCFDCKFFSPRGETHNDLQEKDWDECLLGECRRHVPRCGPLMKNKYGDEENGYAEWPLVMAACWCGEFESKDSPANIAPEAARVAKASTIDPTSPDEKIVALGATVRASAPIGNAAKTPGNTS